MNPELAEGAGVVRQLVLGIAGTGFGALESQTGWHAHPAFCVGSGGLISSLEA